MRLGAFVLAVLLTAGAAAPAASAREPSVTPDWQARMLAYVNDVRAAAGVPPVRPCAPLRRSAERYARTMATTGTVSHTAPDGGDVLDRLASTGYRAAVAGENLAGGQDTVVHVMRAWRGSPTHLATMTDRRFRHVGFGHEASAGTGYGEYWVQHFGAGDSCS